ncbi:prolyl oligopeptidase [Sphingomonas sp. BE270]|jgi:prolyl oligopeptidase|uniref:prolyl oligopeptidase family serine peptidase n=1 Tax=unclassified Sphingomonas TaxID=196159 RepID=UPI00053DB194|nr:MULTISPECIES: prolyl oligopeptidase family serine peptidase [unclassified Sphingomonas]MDR6847549.1 prolyl oligopeptidase [Sphingomonas sp. BE137]MDR7257092.1 prolyl oligopeptidase [Sphingomonas sp. BE270]
MRLTLPLIALVLAAPAQLQAQTMQYPETRRVTQTDEQFGVKVADPYRWLENDVRTDAEVAKWVADENAVTNAYLATLPGRDIFAARLKTLLDYERFGVPVKKGGHYFYTHNSGLQNQAVLYVRDSVDGAGRVLIDPNGWSNDGATALAEWSPSEDGKKLAYAVQDGGTDWRTVKVLDVATGAVSDTIEWVKFSGLAWAKDGSGFYYSRFAAPAAGAKFQALNENQQIYFHKLGTAQAADPLIYATPESPKLGHTAQVTDDGKWLVITTHEGTDNRYQITVIDLTAPTPVPRTIFKGLDYEWSLAGNVGGNFYWVTNKNAPRGRIVATNLYARSAEVPEQELVAQGKDVLAGASLVGGKLLVSYLADVKSEIRRYTLEGKPDGVVPLPGIGAAGGFGGEEGDPETFFAFTSFATPTTIYRYDVTTGQATPWAAPKVAFDPARYTVEQRFYASKDGTQVPMFIVRRSDVTGPAPTLLYAYGGFNISVTPAFSATRLAWLEQGGVLAVANIRGGGEYGKAWHDGGRLANKQNVFDDFIAAGEYLKAQGITGTDQLAIQGGSNGGLLVGAVTNQRPDLFAAALPAVGVMDMLRFDRFTAGRYWVDDYGYPSKEADFKTLYAYSPYHNIRAGKAYPAILAETADTDDRVVPGHTFKYTAMLQSLDLGPKPRLVRIETRAGHGSGKPTDKVIAETADAWAFAAKWTGLTVKPVE